MFWLHTVVPSKTRKLQYTNRVNLYTAIFRFHKINSSKHNNIMALKTSIKIYKYIYFEVNFTITWHLYNIFIVVFGIKQLYGRRHSKLFTNCHVFVGHPVDQIIKLSQGIFKKFYPWESLMNDGTLNSRVIKNYNPFFWIFEFEFF